MGWKCRVTTRLEREIVKTKTPYNIMAQAKACLLEPKKPEKQVKSSRRITVERPKKKAGEESKGDGGPSSPHLFFSPENGMRSTLRAHPKQLESQVDPIPSTVAVASSPNSFSALRLRAPSSEFPHISIAPAGTSHAPQAPPL
ncbi:hypothetical protein PAHAL_9G054900 [Panicum hallii]|uniref:Uncharacterized protein n=1 Tax=Panicum hallii TaxID=206008 RepID=A0A2T8I084_9POAL|nr:hypothetical protein PAHAL_9G054900 [Panicum hallii]